MPSLFWIKASDGEVPEEAFEGGNEDGEETFVGRAYHGAGLIPGKVVPSHNCCYIACGGKEYSYRSYEVLCGKGKWVVSNPGNLIGPYTWPGGYSDDSLATLYIGRVQHDGNLIVGKVESSEIVCYYPYGGEEWCCHNFQILEY